MTLRELLLSLVFEQRNKSNFISFVDNIKELDPYDFLLTFMSGFDLFHSMDGDVDPESGCLMLAYLPLALGARRLLLSSGDVDVLYNSRYNTFAEYVLSMLTGSARKDDCVVLNKMLVLHADHESNASTFVGRISSSTRSSLRCSLISCMACFGGELHGGAVRCVMDMLQEAQNAPDLVSYLKNRQNNNKPIFGFGHRVYKIIDPRASIMRSIAMEYAKRDDSVASLLRIVEGIEVYMKDYDDLGSSPNVDFYAPLLYMAMGISQEYFTVSFVLGRFAGWMAHIFEQKNNNILIRPRLQYNGAHNKIFI